MFKTHIGPVQKDANVAYLRPETAQGIYVNYLLTQNAMRLKIPFGIAQIGKAFRNEIIARNFIFRTREFEQMEMQYFVRPGDDDQSMRDWKDERMAFYSQLGIDSGKLRLQEHGPDELAHYAKEAWDIEFEFPFGWSEIEGIHNRTNFDLARHQEFSGKKMEVFDQENNEHYLPYIIETSAGLNRMLLAVLSQAYWEDNENNRIVMKFHPRIAPVTAAVCPLVKKDGLPEVGRKVMDIVKPHFKVIYDQQGSIGKRYYRQDEAGTPYGITIDHQSLEDKTVTLRHRDSQQQDRVAIDQLVSAINNSMENYT
jgi:glycyl-tRNA synthetase